MAICSNAEVKVSGFLFDTLTSTTTNWTLYSNSTMSPDLGTNTILFQGVGPYSEVGIGNIKLIYNDLTPTINNLQIYFNNLFYNAEKMAKPKILVGL